MSGPISVSELVELTDDERMALPAAEHLPHFDGLGRPHAWICRVCWGDGWVSGWPCPPAVKGGVEVAKAMGVGWSW